MDINAYWSAVLRQDAEELRGYFAPGAWVNWNNTNEHFTAGEFIRANCEYPGDWDGEIEQTVDTGGTVVTALRVWSKGGSLSFHVTSFIRLEGYKIASIDEYWGDDGEAPEWRREKHIGSPIK